MAATALLLSCPFIQAYAGAASINVTGTVTDSHGQPIPGVTVKVKGTNKTTATDLNGIFRLSALNGNEV